MKLSQVQPAALAILAADPVLSTVPHISQLAPDYNKQFAAALLSPGLFLVTAQMGARSLPGYQNKPVIMLENELLVIVCENEKSNQTTHTALGLVERVLEVLHMATYVQGGRKQFRLGEPAYERGPVAEGITSWLCPFRIESLNTITTA